MKANIIENKYRKVLVAAQRAKQLQKGARPLVYVPGMRATTIALEEVERGLINFEVTLIPKPPLSGRKLEIGRLAPVEPAISALLPGRK